MLGEKLPCIAVGEDHMTIGTASDSIHVQLFADSIDNDVGDHDYEMFLDVETAGAMIKQLHEAIQLCKEKQIELLLTGDS